MPEELGKVTKPSVKEYEGGRKLYFLPLVFTPKEPQQNELKEIISKYWSQGQSQLANLEAKIGEAKKVYHELIPIGGEKGIKAIEELNKQSYQIVKTRLDRGSILEPIEENDLLTEFMDWSKCLTVELQNPKVFAKIYEFYVEAQQKRNNYIETKINQTLKENEIGILLMQEGHQIQFPQDLQVFYVSPPALDEIKQWLRTHRI